MMGRKIDMKKLFAVVLSLAMILSLASCGGNAETPAASKPEEAAPAPSAPAAPEEAEKTEAYVATEEGLAATYEALKGKDIRVALSNSYIGNSWRAQMVNSFNGYCKWLQEQGIIKEYYSSSCGNDSDAQINEISNMISSGYDLIVIDAASPTALIPICEEAVERGVTIVSFDSMIDDDAFYSVSMDQYQFGYEQGTYIAEALGGKGNLINIRGVEGTTNDIVRTQGINDAIAGTDIKIVAELWGAWDDATTASVLLDSLSSLKGTEVNAIIQAGGENGVFEALEKVGIPLTNVVIGGDSVNGFFGKMVNENLNGIGVGCPPFLSASAVQMGLQIIAGTYEGSGTYRNLALPVIVPSTAADYYDPSLPANFNAAYTDENNTYHLVAAEVVSAK